MIVGKRLSSWLGGRCRDGERGGTLLDSLKRSQTVGLMVSLNAQLTNGFI